MPTDETREMEEVARDLARTRSELDQTLDELGRRLDPENLRSEARTYVRNRWDDVRERVSAFTSEHATATLGTLAALVALATLARRRRARALDLERAVRTLLEENGFDAERVASAVGRPRPSVGRRVAMLAAVAGLGWAAATAGRGTTPPRRAARAHRRPPVLA